MMRNKLIGLLLALLLLSGCAANHADISAYENTPIAVSGLTQEEFTVTPGELAALSCVYRTASGATAKAGTVNACGPLMNTFLEQYGCQMSDFSKIRFFCADGYKIVLRDEYLTDYEVMLVVSGGEKPLPELQQPLRLLIPGAESSLWAYSVIRMEFVWKEAA